MRRMIPASTLVLGACLALAACGSSSPRTSEGPSAPASPAATRTASATSTFRAHAGLAFGTFYRYIYGPYRAGEFRAVAADRGALSRATLAARFVEQQVAQASAAAETSPALAKLVAPLAVLGAGFRRALVKLRAGSFKMSEIEAANIAISAIKGSATAAGMPIAESTPSAV